MDSLKKKIFEGIKDTAKKTKDKDFGEIKENTNNIKDRTIEGIKETVGNITNKAKEAVTWNYVYDIDDNYDKKRYTHIVKDEDGIFKYLIKKKHYKLSSDYNVLYDCNRNKLGSLVRTRYHGYRAEHSAIYNGSQYEVFLGKSNHKRDCIYMNSGWYLESDFLKNRFKVYDKNDNLVIRITKYTGYYRSVIGEYERFSHSYRLKFNNKEHEIIGIYTVMLIDLHEKSGFQHIQNYG